MDNNKDEKTLTRTEEAEAEPDDISRREATTGGKSRGAGYQRVGAGRENSAREVAPGGRGASIGGIIIHLIDDYRSQVDTKTSDIARLQKELLEIETKISELQIIKKSLDLSNE